MRKNLLMTHLRCDSALSYKAPQSVCLCSHFSKQEVNLREVTGTEIKAGADFLSLRRPVSVLFSFPMVNAIHLTTQRVLPELCQVPGSVPGVFIGAMTQVDICPSNWEQ